MSDIIDTNDDSIEVPVLELEYSKVLEIIKRVNIADSITIISMPDHVKNYTDREKKPISVIVDELIDYQREENSWRLKVLKVADITVEDNSIKFSDKTIFDSDRIIIISKMNSLFIIPGEKSIKEGNCQPNEIIKISNLISSQLFLLQFTDVKNEESDTYDLRVQFSLIDRTQVEDKHEDSN